jgi:hypothetical protein
MAGYVSASELRDVLSLATYMAIFDDGNTGVTATVDASSAVALVLSRAHAEVISYLLTIYGTLPAELPSAVPVLLKSAELDYAVAFSFERHPEYVRTYGEAKRAERWERAERKMERIASTIQRIAPSDNPPEPTPRTSGGIVLDDARRFITTSSDGTWNGGDF